MRGVRPDLIIQMVHATPHEITLVPIGPETNIALALLKDPSIVPLVKEVIVMGGSISGGNVDASAEANIYNDPGSRADCFSGGLALTMVGLDVGNQHFSRESTSNSLPRPTGRKRISWWVSRDTWSTCRRSSAIAGAPMYDPLAVGAAIDPTIVKTEAMHVDVETRGEFSRGETVANRDGTVERNVLHGDHYVIDGVDKVTPNVQVCTGVDAERFIQLFISRLEGK